MEERFGSLGNAWHAGLTELRTAGLDDKTAQLVSTRKLAIDPDAELQRLVDAGIRAVTWHDDGFPKRLEEIYDVPPVLYLRGEILPDDTRSVAVVGTRKPTAYQMAHDLARSGVTVVSGLAIGIDAIVHKAALEAGGRTIAVMGSGPDVMYPREHARLADEIAEHGLGVRPDAQNFPRRNQIMSGMTLGTVVIEAGESSGALITASHALEQDREVFAVPGNVFSRRTASAPTR
jgi:DNA processing protein